MSDKSQVKVYLPDELHQLLNADSRSNSEAVEAALWSEFGGRKKSALEAKKESKLDQAKAIKASIETDQEEYERVMSEVDAIESQIESMKSDDEKYEEDLNELLSEVESGELDRLLPVMTPVRKVADEHAKDAEEVHQDLKRVAAEQDRRIFNTKFMKPREAEQVNIMDKQLAADAFSGDDE